MAKKTKKYIYIAMAVFFLNALTYSMRTSPVSAAQKALSEETMPEPSGSLGSYDCSHDEAVKDAIRSAKDSIDVTGFGITKDNISRVHHYIIRTFPDMCSSPLWTYHMDGNNITKLSFTYPQDRQAVLAKYRALNRVKKQILSGLDSGMTDVEKALALHDYIVSHCKYDSKKPVKTDTGIQMEFSEDAANAYGILINGTGICQGYSMAYAYLMQACKIPCIYVSSETADHAWNLAFLDGHWYHIDTTWDDPTPDKLGYVGHHWFATSTKTMLSYSAEKSDFIATDHGGDVTLQASDQTYETGFWKDTNAGTHYYQNKWYYVDKKTFDIYSYDFAAKEKTRILQKTAQKWRVWDEPGVIYTESQAKTAAFGKDFYYTTPDAIWKIDLENRRESQIFQADTKTGDIYGLGMIGSELFYVQKKQPDSETAETYLPLNLNAVHTGSSHKWAAIDQLLPICTREGTVIYQCTENGCTAILKEPIPKDVNAHEYYKKIEPAYYDHNGSLTQLCKNCKNIRSEQTIYAPKTMKLSSFYFTYNKKIQIPSVKILDNTGRKIKASSYRVTYSNKKSRNPGRYTIHVQFDGLYSGGFSGEYWIAPPAVKIQKAEAKKGSFAISWKAYKTTLVDGYEIYYVPAGSQGQEKTKKISGAHATKAAVKNLKAGTTYWVYLRTYKNTDKRNEPLWSSWSEGIAVKVL